MTTTIKICGVTNLADAEAAVSAGASYLGFIFVEASPRKVSRETATAIATALKGRAKLVGVFKDAPSKEIEEHFTAVGLDLVQYHGAESPEQVAALALPSIKALAIDERFDWANVRRYKDVVEMILLDRPKLDSSPDWLARALDIAASAPADIPDFLFAGGLTPDNVRSVVRRLTGTTFNATPKPQSQAVECGRIVSFHGVDVATGVEKEPGLKDWSRLENFCKSVREEAERCVL